MTYACELEEHLSVVNALPVGSEPKRKVFDLPPKPAPAEFISAWECEVVGGEKGEWSTQAMDEKNGGGQSHQAAWMKTGFPNPASQSEAHAYGDDPWRDPLAAPERKGGNSESGPANNSAADKAELDAAQLKVDNAKAAVDADKDDAAAADDLVKAEGELKAVQDKQAAAAAAAAAAADSATDGGGAKGDEAGGSGSGGGGGDTNAEDNKDAPPQRDVLCGECDVGEVCEFSIKARDRVAALREGGDAPMLICAVRRQEGTADMHPPWGHSDGEPAEAVMMSKDELAVLGHQTGTKTASCKVSVADNGDGTYSVKFSSTARYLLLLPCLSSSVSSSVFLSPTSASVSLFFELFFALKNRSPA